MCVSFFSFFMKAILSFFDFWTFFVVFDFSFHFCFDQLFRKRFFHFYFLPFFSRCAGRRAAPFSVGLFMCVFVCVFSSFRAFLGSWRPRGEEGAEAYDSGRGADYRGGKGL